MATKEIWIKIKNDSVWFNHTDCIDIRCTDIPIDHLTFTSHRDIYWKVGLKSFDKTSGKLVGVITDYNAEAGFTFQTQKPKFAIQFLEFGTFNWSQLAPLLSAYRKSQFIDRLTHVHESSSELPALQNQPNRPAKKPVSIDILMRSGVHASTGINDKVSLLHEKFTVDFSDCVFVAGAVRFSKRLKKPDQTLDFIIYNDNILPEFDHIKYWFSKKLKTKKFFVNATIVLTGFHVKEISATSPEIACIDQDFIDGVKAQRTLQITKTIRPPDIDKSLFTSDDVYDTDHTNDLSGNVFRQSEKDILDMIMEKSNVRNKRELMYLSGNKHSDQYRIRFTNHPHFGFLFLAEGECNNHFIWELLNSHATYIWSMAKTTGNPEWQYKKMEAVINTILAQGREQYKRAYVYGHKDDDVIFNVVHHADKGSELIDGFPKWKHRINALLT